MRRICCLLLFILPMFGACSFHVYPRYQPIAENSSSFSPVQGFHETQLDPDTYLIIYMNYFSFSPRHGLLNDPIDDKWLHGAQDYVLYRAAELTQAKGAQYFVVLHQDDWNLISVGISHKGIVRHDIEPGAGIIIRVLSNYPSLMPPSNNRVYEVGMLLQSLAEKNRGLAEYQKKTVHVESAKTAGNRFSRWRSSVSGYDSVPVPGTRQKNLFGSEYVKFEPGSAIIPQTPFSQFELAMWDHRLIPPLQFLAECVKLANREGFETFKLVNWTVEEHRTDGNRGNWKVWFRTKATVILQHQKEPGSLDPVFAVNEIRSNISTTQIKP